jgi:hypothetical protein
MLGFEDMRDECLAIWGHQSLNFEMGALLRFFGFFY